MANNVFANGMEISCKAADGKAIAAFPDVCFTPPTTPATPPGVPIPYPNTALASDASGGSRSVKISDKEIMLKNKSYFKKSMGNEAGCAPKKGVVTSTNCGKVYFTSWSMNVKIEGSNAVRHLDLTTHNHASLPGNTAPWSYLDRMAMSEELAICQSQNRQIREECDPWEEKAACPEFDVIKTSVKKARSIAKDRGGDNSPMHNAAKKVTELAFEQLADEINDNPCQRKLRCVLTPKKGAKCCPGQTPHHMLEASAFTNRAGWEKVTYGDAPCICVEGESQTVATHGKMHTRQSVVALHKKDSKGEWSRAQATETSVKAMSKTFPDSACDEKCTKAQLDAYYDKVASQPEKPIKAVSTMANDPNAQGQAAAEMGTPWPLSSVR